MVPSSLRKAQESFTEAIEETIIQLMEVIQEMREIEGKIEELRKLPVGH